MSGFEIPFIWQVIIDVIIGIILGGIVERIQRVAVAAGVAGFLFSIFVFAFGNSDVWMHRSIEETSQVITVIVTATVYFVLNIVIIEIGAIPSNLVSQFFKNR